MSRRRLLVIEDAAHAIEARRTLSLPLSAALTDGEAERVADAFVAIIRGAARVPRRVGCPAR